MGFIRLGGFFVSFMSGNSTRLAVGLMTSGDAARTAAAIIASFLAGVMLGSFVRAAAGSARKAVILMVVTVLLGFAALLGHDTWAGYAMAAAMGAENAVFQRDGEVAIPLTYVTGTVVKFGQGLANALMGGDRWGWVQHLILWWSLVGGAVGGAAAYLHFGPNALWGAAGFAALMTAYALAVGPAE